MALQFNPYGEMYQGIRMEQDQRRGGMDRINQTLQQINQQSLQSIEERKSRERQAMLDKLLFDKQDMDRQQQAYEYGTPIDPNVMTASGPENLGRSSFMPGGQGPVSTNASPLIEQFNKWRAGGMGKATVQPEFMPALGRDERKMLFERDNPKPVANYVIPNLDASGNVSGFTPLPAGSKPAGGMAKPPAPRAGDINNDPDKIRATFNLYETARDGLLSGLEGSATGPILGRIPSFTANQQVAEGGVAAMAPVLKQLFRVAGEGVFTDRDQALLLQMIPTRATLPEARAKQIENIDSIVKAKLGMSSQGGGAGGKIRVRNRQTGQTGSISEKFFDPNKYERVQ